MVSAMEVAGGELAKFTDAFEFILHSLISGPIEEGIAGKYLARVPHTAYDLVVQQSKARPTLPNANLTSVIEEFASAQQREGALGSVSELSSLLGRAHIKVISRLFNRKHL